MGLNHVLSPPYQPASQLSYPAICWRVRGRLAMDEHWMWQLGRDSINKRPYCLLTRRLSSMTTTPRSLWVRISRPKPCLKRKMASGRLYSAKGFSKLSARAAMMGVRGHVKRQLDDDQRGERFARDVDPPFPKGAGAQQDGAVAFLERFQQG